MNKVIVEFHNTLPDTIDHLDRLPDIPVPSLAEVSAMATLYAGHTRICVVRNDTAVLGVMVWCVYNELMHGMDMKVYRPVGNRMHDYTAFYADTSQIVTAILEAAVLDARNCQADVIAADGLILECLQSGPIRKHLRNRQNWLFCSDLADQGWDTLFGKKSVRRHINKAKKLPDYTVTTNEGYLEYKELEFIAEAHLERWAFEGKQSAFGKDNRILEYGIFPTNKVITRVNIKSDWIAIHYGMKYGNTLLWHTPIINIKYLDYSPLEVLLGETFAYCKEHGYNCIDYGQDQEDYKARFANNSRLNYSMLIPVSRRSKVLCSISAFLNPQKIKAFCENLWHQIHRTRYLFIKLTESCLFYESQSVHSECRDSRLNIAHTWADYVDICRMTHVQVTREQYERYKYGSVWVGLILDNNVLSSGWISNSNHFHVAELAAVVNIQDGLLLYDFITPNEHRKKGYYTALLNAIRGELSPTRLLIFCDHRNVTSKRGIEKAGFCFIKELYFINTRFRRHHVTI